MKTQLTLVVFLLVLLTGSCHKNTDIGPAGLLNQRWQFSQGRGVDDTTWYAPYKPYVDDTEYRPDGALVYRRNGVVMPMPCCSGSRYRQDGTTISYSDFSACLLSFCAPVRNATIRILRDDLLELQQGNTITQYTPVR